MPHLAFKAAYLLSLLAQMAIRVPYNRVRQQNKIAKDQMSRQETLILLLLLLANFILPLIYIFTPWLGFADYRLPAWAGWLGVAVLAGAVVVFWQAHRDLGRNWSPTVQIREGQDLITHGIYRYVRHPMYSSQWLWVIAQPLLLQNWVAGAVGPLAFLVFYLARVPVEERMMLEQFGEQYRDYARRTGRVVPRLGKPV